MRRSPASAQSVDESRRVFRQWQALVGLHEKGGSATRCRRTGEKGLQIEGWGMKMANWLERARREIPKSARRRTANSAERTLTAVTAVPDQGLWEKSAASIGSNGSTSSGDFSEIEATINRPCNARSDDDGNGAALLSDLREYLLERDQV
jgi:hypothetical protein